MKKINGALNILVWKIFFINFFNEIRKKKITAFIFPIKVILIFF